MLLTAFWNVERTGLPAQAAVRNSTYSPTMPTRTISGVAGSIAGAIVAQQVIEALIDATKTVLGGDSSGGLLLEAVEALEVEFDAGQRVGVGE